MKFIESHRKELQSKYKKFETFNDKFEISDEILANMQTLAEQEKIKFDEKQYQEVPAAHQNATKALIARDLWDMNEYFQIMNTTDSSVLQDPESSNEGAYEKGGKVITLSLSKQPAVQPAVYIDIHNRTACTDSRTCQYIRGIMYTLIHTDTPTEQAHKAEGAITYHLGYFMHREVASAKADAVCPEGNEGLLSWLYGCTLSG